MSDRLARAALTRLVEPGDLRMARLVADIGAEEVYSALRAERDLRGLETEVAARLAGIDPRAELAQARARGIRFVVPGDAEWPEQMGSLLAAEPVDRIGGPPLGLWVRGPLPLDECAVDAVAVVGSRSATTYGTGVAGEIAAGLAEQGHAVVSGAAFGIDQAAHRGALAMRGVTLAVLACGVDRAYPAAHAGLLDLISETGLIVSELPPGTSPTRLRFLARNRLIAALARGTVVVEAAARSGALNTANWTSRLHRLLMAVPGPVTSATSVGSHHLVRARDAQLVTCADDVVELVSPVGSHVGRDPQGERRPTDDLGPDDRRVVEALPAVRPASLAAVARTAGLPVERVTQALERLRGRGLAERGRHGWRVVHGSGDASA
jgi:DNA processing protein